MRLSRRAFLVGGSAGAALAALSAPGRLRLADARGNLAEPTLDAIVGRALAAARKAGASYADVRLVRRRKEWISAREDHVAGAELDETYGVGVRVLVGGAWGFAATPTVTVTDAERMARRAVAMARASAKGPPVKLAPVTPRVAVWQSPIEADPFKVPLSEKAELLLAINAAALAVKRVRFCASSVSVSSEWKLLATSEGAHLEQEILRIDPLVTITVVDDARGAFTSLSHALSARQAGWEHLARSTLLADAPALAERALEKLGAASVTPGKRDLVITPSNLHLTIHESIGHATELDRALGDEADAAGTSHATPDKLGKLRFGGPHLTFYGDKTTRGGLATCGFDDDGVPTGRFDLVKDGLFVGYQTTREQAGWIGEKASRGTCYADSYDSFPFQRMPNVSLAPGPAAVSLEDLIAATDDGILVDGAGSWSIDHQRLNFQFSGQLFWEIKRGKRTRMLKDVAYQASALEFWNGCDRIGGEASWELHGVMDDGKGEPGQLNAVSHGCPPARFRQVNVVNTGDGSGR